MPHFRPVDHARATYFFYFMAFGCYSPFITLYFERLGLSGTQIGSLLALSILVTIVSSFFWSAFADSRRAHRPLLWTSLALAAVTVWAVAAAQDFMALLPVIVLFALVGSPIQSLIDGFALEVVNLDGRGFGEMRLWGAIGWALATVGMGAVIENSGIRWVFYGYSAVMGLTFILALLQPRRRRTLRMSFGSGLRRLWRPDLIVFFISVFLLATSFGGVESFISVLLDRMGAGGLLIGICWTIAALTEVPVMLYSGALMRRIGSARLLQAGFVFYALCWAGYSLIRDPIWAPALQVLNGLGFGCFFTGGVTFLNERTPEGLSTTAQSIFNSICFGAAWIAGSLLGGFLFDRVSIEMFFRALAFVAVGGLVVLSLGSRVTGGVAIESQAEPG
ncbi:MAG: MFS transporter [Rudaea sp.]